MASQAGADEIFIEFMPYIRFYKSGRVERLEDDIAPASVDAATGGVSSKDVVIDAGTGVSSKDVVIDAGTGVSARLYLPNAGGEVDGRRLPLLINYHGGGFCIGSAFSRIYHDYISALAACANAVVVSVHYRLAPEHPISAVYEDSWAALRWAVSGADTWLAEWADLGRVFLAGESAGANIVHHMAMRAGMEAAAEGVRIEGIVLIHPYFLGPEGVESEAIDQEQAEALKKLWGVVAAGAGLEDPMINPVDGEAAASLRGLGARRALVLVAEKDVLKDRGRAYFEKVRESGWSGEVELHEIAGKGHAFHLLEQACEEALEQNMDICRFLNRE